VHHLEVTLAHEGGHHLWLTGACQSPYGHMYADDAVLSNRGIITSCSGAQQRWQQQVWHCCWVATHPGVSEGPAVTAPNTPCCPPPPPPPPLPAAQVPRVVWGSVWWHSCWGRGGGCGRWCGT
jgi:hypothetical protein